MEAHIDFVGEGVVKASDIQVDPDIEIVNPDLVIAHLNGGADCKLSMELTITNGRGYVSSEKNKKEDQPVGTFLGFEPITFVPIATSPVVPGVLTRDELDWLNAYHREVFTKLAPHLTEEERDWLAKKCAAIGA